MPLRNLLVALIVVATAAFVVGTSIERTSGESGNPEPTASARSAAVARAVPSGVGAQAGGESAATHAREGAAKPAVAERTQSSGAQVQVRGESAATRAGAAAVPPGVATAERPHAELRPLGINVESWPFAAIAALLSLGLAVAAWLRPSLAKLLGCVLVAMVVFVALDVSEVVHQSDVDKTGLAVLAGIVAALHLAAAGVAAAMATRASRPHAGRGPAGGMMPA